MEYLLKLSNVSFFLSLMLLEKIILESQTYKHKILFFIFTYFLLKYN